MHIDSIKAKDELKDRTLFASLSLAGPSWLLNGTGWSLVCASWSLPGPSQIDHLRSATNQLLAKSKRWFWEHGGQPANNQL